MNDSRRVWLSLSATYCTGVSAFSILCVQISKSQNALMQLAQMRSVSEDSYHIRKQNMYMDNFDCCKSTCGETC